MDAGSVLLTAAFSSTHSRTSALRFKTMSTMPACATRVAVTHCATHSPMPQAVSTTQSPTQRPTPVSRSSAAVWSMAPQSQVKSVLFNITSPLFTVGQDSQRHVTRSVCRGARKFRLPQPPSTHLRPAAPSFPSWTTVRGQPEPDHQLRPDGLHQGRLPSGHGL